MDDKRDNLPVQSVKKECTVDRFRNVLAIFFFFFYYFLTDVCVYVCRGWGGVGDVCFFFFIPLFLEVVVH